MAFLLVSVSFSIEMLNLVRSSSNKEMEETSISHQKEDQVDLGRTKAPIKVIHLFESFKAISLIFF